MDLSLIDENASGDANTVFENALARLCATVSGRNVSHPSRGKIMKKTTIAALVASALIVAAGLDFWLSPAGTWENRPPAPRAAPATPAAPPAPLAPAAPATPPAPAH